MTKDTMLGRIMQSVAVLPLERLGVVRDIAEKLSGKDWQKWLTEFKKFLKRKPCWTRTAETVSMVSSEFLKLLSDEHNLTIDALDGKEILAEAKDVFAWIDGDFRNWCADEQGDATAETAVEVYELIKNGRFSQFFGSAAAGGDPNTLCFTQAQIKNFCVKHRKLLRAGGYSTFFLFKSNSEYFVARVYFTGDDRLGVYVLRFEYDFVYHAGYRSRVVIPQLAA